MPGSLKASKSQVSSMNWVVPQAGFLVSWKTKAPVACDARSLLPKQPLRKEATDDSSSYPPGDRSREGGGVMAWVRLEDTFPEHPKVDAAGGDAGWLHVCAIAYCNRNTTDGFIATNRVPQLSDRRQPFKLVDKLVAVGLWEVDERGGWRIHDYLHYQPSKATIDAEKEKARERMRKARDERSGNVRANIERSSGNVRVTRPVPTRPDVSTLTSSTSSPVTRTPSSLDDAKVKEALRLYAEAETARYGKGPKYRDGILNKAEHWAQLVALNLQRPDCTPQALADAHAKGEGWPVRQRTHNAHGSDCICKGERTVRDAAGYAEPCPGILRLVAG